jgi:hypothetical protein
MKCPYCGKEVSDKASSCEFCGKSFDVNSLVSDLLNGSGKSDAVNLSPEVTAGAAVAAQEIKKEAGKAKAEKAVKACQTGKGFPGQSGGGKARRSG